MSQPYTIAPDILIERFGDETLVFVPASDHWVRLNETAAALLEAACGDGSDQLTDAGLALTIVARYGVALAEALAAAQVLLEDWERAGIACRDQDEECPTCQNPGQ